MSLIYPSVPVSVYLIVRPPHACPSTWHRSAPRTKPLAASKTRNNQRRASISCTALGSGHRILSAVVRPDGVASGLMIGPRLGSRERGYTDGQREIGQGRKGGRRALSKGGSSWSMLTALSRSPCAVVCESRPFGLDKLHCLEDVQRENCTAYPPMISILRPSMSKEERRDYVVLRPDQTFPRAPFLVLFHSPNPRLCTLSHTHTSSGRLAHALPHSRSSCMVSL